MGEWREIDVRCLGESVIGRARSSAHGVRGSQAGGARGNRQSARDIVELRHWPVVAMAGRSAMAPLFRRCSSTARWWTQPMHLLHPKTPGKHEPSDLGLHEVE